MAEIGSLYYLHSILGLAPTSAVAISFWVGFIVAFIMQKYITFQNNDRQVGSVTKQLLGYSLLVGWNYVFTLGAVALCTSFVSVYVIRTVVIAITTLWNYVLYDRLFAKKGPRCV